MINRQCFGNLAWLFIGFSALLSSSLFAQEQRQKPAQEIREPEAATGFSQKSRVIGQQYMVVAANPYASKAGANVLAKGGSAVDAAIAIQMVLTLVEPQSSGIGGGAFMLHWDKKNKQLTSFDGRETAPQAATSALFLNDEGKPVSWLDAVVGGRSVGVPGVLAALHQAHQQYGKLAWHELFDDAIQLAEQGFVVSPRLEKLIAVNFNPGIQKLEVIKQYFYPDGKQIRAGDVLVNKPLAKVFKSIAKQGVKVFYQGWLAEKIVKAVNNSPIAPGKLALSDMKNYQAKQVEAVCGSYKEHQLCGMAPPSSGSIAVIQILKMLEPFQLQDKAVNGLDAIHLFTQSSRLAFADRDKYIADPAFTQVPTAGLLNDVYLKQRAQLINPLNDMGKAVAGQPTGALAYANDQAYELPSTSHFSIIDRQGNAVSMTSSIEMGFGSALMVEGFILNNQLTDFSLKPEVDGKLVANRVEAGKRPRSSMSPMMVFDREGELKIIIGSPGGSRIINYVAQTLIAMLDWQLEPQQAVSLAHVTNRNKITTLEKGTELTKLADALTLKGHQVAIRDLNSGLHVIEVKESVDDKTLLIGGADPRREGQVLSD